ncbi:MAG: oligopeptide transporter, OPT family [Caulobacteraceae bacterium]|nr:oligopeptide transporter, OPT family [Caulobacteraceae bacterium]
MPVTDSSRPGSGRLELTIRGLILGAVITLFFTAANVYLGLRVGLTFATSIPAAVISMAVLRLFRNSTIWENNIVQTVASAAGTLASIIFVLPGLIMIGWWTGFPFWTSFLICALGGVLGVTFSVPLRRALVTGSSLPYPEGVAAAEVLKVGSGSKSDSAEAAAEGKAGLVTVIVGSVASLAFAVGAAMRVFAAEAAVFFRVGAGSTGVAGGLSLALLGAGHLVGLSVGLAMLFGLLIAWGGAVPLMTAMQNLQGPAEEVANNLWRSDVRLMGAGTIAVAAIWTLTKLAGPIAGGLKAALAAQSKRVSGKGSELPIVERDIPIGLVGLISIACLVPIAWLFWDFTTAGQGASLAQWAPALVGGAMLYVVVIGFLVAAVCGYMAGLIGSSNSPVSGVGILAVITASLLLLGLMVAAGIPADPAVVAFALFATAVVFTIATISNDNLQDLKTGQLVEATPWRQQFALMIGVLAGAAVIPPILDLLNTAYGFAGGPVSTIAGVEPLPAPQATLISSLAKGVITGDLRWDLIGYGAGLGVVVIALDELLGRVKAIRLPPLAVGIGIYLPMATTSAVVVGAVLGWLYDKWAGRHADAEARKRLGVLLASGMIVGESLFGVILAGLIVGTNNGTPLSVVPDSFAPTGVVVGALAFAVVTLGLYLWTMGKAGKLGRRG